MSRIFRPNSTEQRSIASFTTSSVLPRGFCFFDQSRTSSMIDPYASIPAAAWMSDGFVVASCGLNVSIELKSPVSATTVVMPLS